jgi:geranylgeranyl diphosphate synthase type I
MSLAELAPQYLAAIEDALHLAIGSEHAHREEYLARRGAAAQGEAHQLLAGDLHEYYAMLEYHLGWGGRTAGGTAGGKRIRPLLCLLCASAAGADWRLALPVAAAVELIHNFSLIHDDIQDNSPLRRGRPTVWQQWGQAQAINAGDAMFALAHLAPQRLIALGVAPKVALEALAELNYTCLELTQGQHLDMLFEHRPMVSVPEHMAMIEKKTAVLIAAAALLGASLAGNNSERLDHFYAYGWNLGLAFQFQDDLLGIWGDPVITGKSAASDLEKRKKSLPVVFGLEHSAGLAQAYSQPHRPGESVAGLAAELERLGARDYVEGRVRETTTRAEQELEHCRASEPAGQALRDLTLQLLHRTQ